MSTKTMACAAANVLPGLLDHSPLFKAMRPEHAIRIVGAAEHLEVRRHERLCAESTPVTHCWMVVSGWIQAYRLSARGKSISITCYTMGDLVGEAVAQPGTCHKYSAMALTRARVLKIPADVLAELLTTFPDAAAGMLSALLGRFEAVIDTVTSNTSHTVTERLANFLVQTASVDRGAAEVELPPFKSVLAAQLSTTPESVSRALGRLRDVGVETQGRRAIIRDVQTLKSLISA